MLNSGSEMEEEEEEGGALMNSATLPPRKKEESGSWMMIAINAGFCIGMRGTPAMAISLGRGMMSLGGVYSGRICADGPIIRCFGKNYEFAFAFLA